MKLIIEIRECGTNEVVFVTDWENFVKYGLTEPGFYAIVRSDTEDHWFSISLDRMLAACDTGDWGNSHENDAD